MPQLVFVTAYDEYAARAFDAQAIDYVLKPVQPERLRRPSRGCSRRWQPQRNGAAPSAEDALAGTLAQWRQLLAAAGGAGRVPGAGGTAPLKLIAASEAGSAAAPCAWCRSTRCCTSRPPTSTCACSPPTREYLIRTPLKQLLPQLDAGRVLAGASRHGGAQRRHRVGAPRRGGQAAPGAARARGEDPRQPALRPPLQGHVASAHEKTGPEGRFFHVTAGNRGCLRSTPVTVAVAMAVTVVTVVAARRAVVSGRRRRSTPGPDGSRPAAAGRSRPGRPDGSTQAAAARNTPGEQRRRRPRRER